jgi:hypothetical protein
MISTTTLTPLELLCRTIRDGWAVRFIPTTNVYEWRRPDGLTGSEYQSTDLLVLPYRVLRDLATEAGE